MTKVTQVLRGRIRFNLCPSFVIEKEEKNSIVVFSRDSQQKATTSKLVKTEKEGIENYSQGGQAEDTL